MVYIQPFLRLVVSGTLYTTEGFSWGLSLISTTQAVVPPNEVPQAVIDAVLDYHTDAVNAIGNEALLTTIKLNEIGPDGRYTNQGDTVLHEFDPPVAGTASTKMPPQLSLCISLGTDANRGRAHAGRYYLPAASFQVQSNGGISEAQQQLAATSAATLIQSLNAAMPDYLVGVVSDIGTGTQRLVTNVRVGRVIDTMRSRRTSLDEAYQEALIT